MAIEQGSLIYVNFTAKVKDTGEAVETTLEDQAKSLGIYDQARRYEPRLIAVGEGWVLKGLDEELKLMGLGEKKTVELTPDKAWGERDPTLLRMVPMRKFGEKAAELRVGDVVEVDNRLGIARFIGSGRAQIDFNHRLAGKTLIYEVETIRKLESDGDKIRALINRRLPGEGDKVAFTQEETRVVVEVPEELFLIDGLQIIKRGIGNDVLHFITAVKKVTFQESYISTEKKEEGKTEEGAKEEEEGKEEGEGKEVTTEEEGAKEEEEGKEEEEVPAESEGKPAAGRKGRAAGEKPKKEA